MGRPISAGRVASDPNRGESHFGKTEVRNALNFPSPEMKGPRSPKYRNLSGSSDSKGHVAPDPRSRDFMTQGFLHGA
jgi:hypothetical protein